MPSTRFSISVVACLLTALLLAAPGTLGAQAGKVVRIAVVSDGPSPDFQAQLDALRVELSALLGNTSKLELDAQPRAADWTAEGVNGQLQTVYADKQLDAVIGLGVLTAGAVAARPTLERPTLLPFVVEAKLGGLPQKGKASGKTNLSYISGVAYAEQNLQLLRDMAGSKNVAVVLGPVPAAFEQNVRDYLAAPAKKLGMLATLVPAQPTAAAILAALPQGCDGVLLAQLPQLPVTERPALLQGLQERKLASVSTAGRGWVEQGALMSLDSSENISRRARRAALQLSQILDGKDAGTQPVMFEPKQEFVVNLAVARAIGVRPSFKVLTEAVLINQTDQADSAALDLPAAMAEAVSRNVTLDRERAVVRAGQQRVETTQGTLWPQVEAQTGLRTIDPDRAEAGFVPQTNASWGIRARQTLYEEGSWMNYKVESKTQDARVQNFERSRLDTMLDAGLAYVELLRARTNERIQRENLLRSKKNLDLARVRVAVGTADISEEYRWQVEVADSQRSVINTGALRSASEIELNRVLYRDPEAAIDPQELPYDEATGLRAGDEALAGYTADPWSFKQFRDFMVLESIAHSPEVREIDASVGAQKRLKSGLKRQLWLPRLFAEGGIDHDFWNAGAGTSPPPDKFGWNVGVFATLPLFTGMSRTAEIGQSTAEIDRLQSERLRIEQVLGTNTRSVIHRAGAALSAVSLTRDASVAAGKNLELVTDNYQQGTVDIITLIDAQTRALVAALAAAGAVYDYMGAMLRVDRAVGYYRFLQSEVEQAEYLDRLKKYFAQHPTP
jgi:outer membrane protein